MFATTALKLQKPIRVIFFGDSITEMGVQAEGYITKMRERLDRIAGGSQYELIGAGISGNKVYDLYLRLDVDVLNKNPDVVVLYVGVNDVWHKTLSRTGTDADKFERFFASIIRKLQHNNIKLILCTPSVIGERKEYSNPQDEDLNFYSQIIRNLAATFGCLLCDLRKAFVEYGRKNNLKNSARGVLTTDEVHLNEKGNQLVADLLMVELIKNEYEGAGGEILRNR